MTDGGPGYELRQVLRALSQRLGEVRLPLALPGVEADRQQLDDLTGQLRDYLLPRVARPRSPALAVLVGGTGSGRSTLLNSLVGAVVSPSGVLRPTTRTPVMVHHPADARWFGARGAAGVLSSWTRASSESDVDVEAGTLRVVARPAVPPGLALIDAPDGVSAVRADRAQGGQLGLVADLSVFVVSAERYADAAQDELLQAAATRNAAGAVVLNGVRPNDVDELRRELSDRLTRYWLEPPPLFVVEQTTLSNALLPSEAIVGLRDWLAGVAGTKATRTAMVRQTLDGVLRGLPERVQRIAEAVEAQAEAANRLRMDARKSYDEAVRHVETAGPLTDAEAPVVIATAADRAEERVDASWRSMPAGAALLNAERPTFVSSRSAPAGVEELMNVECMRYESLLGELGVPDPEALQLREVVALLSDDSTETTDAGTE